MSDTKPEPTPAEAADIIGVWIENAGAASFALMLVGLPVLALSIGGGLLVGGSYLRLFARRKMPGGDRLPYVWRLGA